MKRVLFSCLALSLVGACGSRVRNWDEQLAAQEQSTTVTRRADSTTKTTQAATRNGSQSSTGRARPTTTLKSVENTGPLPAPKPGRYTYDESSGDETMFTYETWRITKASATELLTSVTQATGDEDRGSRTTTLRTTNTERFVLSATDEFDGEASVCTYKPPLKTLQLPLRVGAAWKSQSTCKTADGTTQTFTMDARVTGEADDTVGGVKVHTFVIATNDTLSQTFNDEQTTDDTGGFGPVTIGYSIKRTIHLDPTTLLVVVDDQEITPSFEGADDFEDAGAEDTIKVHRQLRSLTPR